MNKITTNLIYNFACCVRLSVCRGPETQVLRAKCSNTRIYCTLLCKNTAAATEEESCEEQ